MIPASPDMMARASKHHAPRWRVTTSDGQDWTYLFMGGRIRRDSTRNPRTTFEFTLTERGRPGMLDQSLLPLGRDVTVRYRIHPYPEEITIAHGRQVNADLSRDDSTWRMRVVDHSSVIAEDVTRPEEWTDRPGTVDALITAIVTRTLPGAQVNITGSCVGADVPADLEMDGDPWRIIDGLAQGCGAEAYFDTAGTCVVRDEPVLAGTGADWLKVGSDGTITAYEIGHESAYSRVEIRYEDKSDPPIVVIGTWEDHRPESPTAIERIGRVTLRQDHGGLLGLPPQTAADSAAAALAVRAAGRGRRAVVRHIPRPWIEPGDTLAVTFSGGPTELQMVESVDIPIGPDVQTTALRNATYIVEAGAA